MSAAQWQRLKEIFHSAQQLPPNERSAFLDQSCGGDAELRREIDALLKSDNEADGFMVNPPAQLAKEVFGKEEIPFRIGRTIGQYRLLERIGSGGMGEVYLAERADQQFKMQVAIKLIKRGMDTESVLRRFQHERQILASLQHPNIARLLDGGETEDGLPYFVMEHVEGERIDHYAEAKNLSLNERLELFRQVCGAVSYAHQHLVVHRDLKPSNILVTPEGVPKLLDFGIAKLVQADADAEAFATITIMPVMTPEYASPEQFDGAAATTLSDVYSLGAVLYELLSGQTPYRLKTRSPQDFARVVTTEEPPRPSTVIGKKPSEIRNQKSLRGDLDNIVLMAMRRETARRYRSVEQFSEDIRRHLKGLPVIARRDTLSYRAAKFVRRNRIAISAAAVLVLTLVAGVVATTWQARKASIQEHRARGEQARAERRFNDVRKLANSVLFDYHDAIKDLPGATKVRERLVKDGLSYLDSLAGEAQGDPELQRELAAAYERVGDVRGGAAGGGSLGDIAGAIESYTKALRVREALVALNPNDARARRDLARSHRILGDRLPASEDHKDLEHLRKALTLYLELTREQPANDEIHLDLAETRDRLGGTLNFRDDVAGALEQFRAALAICEKLVLANPQDRKYRHALWTSYAHVGYTLWLQTDAAGALEANRKALALGEALLAADPINADYRRGLVLNYQNAGDILTQSDKGGALKYFRRALALDEELLAADPANALTRKDLAYTHKRIADFFVDLKNDSEALLHFSKALEGYQRVVTESQGGFVSRFLVVSCRAGVAQMRAKLGEVDPALEECRKAVAALQEITGYGPGHLGRAQAYEYLGYAYVAMAASPKVSARESRQQTSAARDMFQQSLNVLDELRNRQGTLGANEEWAKEIAAEIAKCDTALKE